MKVLLDECCPAPLQKVLRGAYDVLITADKNLRYQQNVTNRKVTIIELPFNSWKKLQTMIPEIEAALDSVRPGQYVEVPAPMKRP